LEYKVDNAYNNLKDVKTSVQYVENLVNTDTVWLHRVEYELELGKPKIE
jgi:hypothetical protein